MTDDGGNGDEFYEQAVSFYAAMGDLVDASSLGEPVDAHEERSVTLTRAEAHALHAALTAATRNAFVAPGPATDDLVQWWNLTLSRVETTFPELS